MLWPDASVANSLMGNYCIMWGVSIW